MSTVSLDDLEGRQVKKCSACTWPNLRILGASQEVVRDVYYKTVLVACHRCGHLMHFLEDINDSGTLEREREYPD